MPVLTRVELVAGVVAVHQVDAAGDRHDLLDRAGQLDPRRVGMAGVQAEPDITGAADHVPEPGDVVERACHGPVAARRVLDQQRNRPRDLVDRLGPVEQPVLRVVLGRHVPAVHDKALGADRGGRLELLLDDGPARVPDPVVGARQVHRIGRVDVHIDPRVFPGLLDLRGVAGDDRRLPVLRVAEEELRNVRLGGDGFLERVVDVEVGSDARDWHASEPRTPRAPVRSRGRRTPR
jgi:hypothetical protein